MGCREIAYCASARSGYSGASIISCVTSYFLLHASDFVLDDLLFVIGQVVCLKKE